MTLIEKDKVVSKDKEVVETFGSYFVTILENLGINKKFMSEEPVSNESVTNIITKFQNHPSIIKIKENHRVGDARGNGGYDTLFCVAKTEKEKKGKKEKVTKQKLLKVCHQGQNVAVLAILERLKFKKCYCQPTMVTNNIFQCSIAPAL